MANLWYYQFLYLLIGLGSFLAFKAVSDYSSRNASLSISYEDNADFRETTILSNKRIEEAITYAKKTAQTAISDATWVRISDIKETLVGALHGNEKEIIGFDEELEFSLGRLPSGISQAIYKDIIMVGHGKACCCALTYNIYESSINNGNYGMGKTAKALLSKNRIICAGELGIAELQRVRKNGRRTIIVSIAPEHPAKLSNMERSYTRYGALLLLCQLTGNIRSVNYVDNQPDGVL